MLKLRLGDGRVDMGGGREGSLAKQPSVLLVVCYLRFIATASGADRNATR